MKELITLEEIIEINEDESEEIKNPSKKAIFEALQLIKGYAHLHADVVSQKIRHCAAQSNKMFTMI